MQQLVLASASRYRRELLARLHLPFDVVAADVDESPQEGERPPSLAARLARNKAHTVLARVDAPGVIVIGSDQVAECEGRILGKPGTRDRAVEQLSFCAGRVVTYHTAVCVLGGPQGEAREHIDVTRVVLRPLNDVEIRHYLEHEDALDCAGALKSEGLGVTLMSAYHSNDPTALIGLPLIWLSTTLRDLGVASESDTPSA